jgi:hypothetical protein
MAQGGSGRGRRRFEPKGKKEPRLRGATWRGGWSRALARSCHMGKDSVGGWQTARHATGGGGVRSSICRTSRGAGRRTWATRAGVSRLEKGGSWAGPERTVSFCNSTKIFKPKQLQMIKSWSYADRKFSNKILNSR